MKGLLYLISAPSGAGKTSLVSALLKHDPKIKLSISHTTRKPRVGEIDGQHYYFIDKPKFEQLIIEDYFLEQQNVYGNFYGTGKEKVEILLNHGFDVILEIDWQGARQVKEKIPEAISICIAPPSIQALRNRLEARGTDEQSVIDNRMQQAEIELKFLADANFVVINDNFSEAVKFLQAIFSANRQLFKQQQQELVERGLI